jgi:Tfp pilus assembly protein FimT
VTLIELLMVITIILSMLALAAHRMQLAKDARRNREAARAIAVYFGAARSTALANRRPCGVMLVSAGTTGGLQNCVMVLQQCEIPPPYAGDSTGATATVATQQGVPGGYQASNMTGASNMTTLVHQYDVIQFNYEGPWYTISQSPTSSTSLSLTLDTSQGQLAPWNNQQSAPVPFRIYRQPMYRDASGNTHANKSMAAPLQLPAGAVIDLGYSGTDAGTIGGITTPICIRFSPAGAVDSVFLNGQPSPVSQPIYLLVGQPDKARGFGTGQIQYNYQNLENLWVVINPQSGLVTTAPVGSATPSASSGPTSVSDSRGLARTAQLQGGW